VRDIVDALPQWQCHPKSIFSTIVNAQLMILQSFKWVPPTSPILQTMSTMINQRQQCQVPKQRAGVDKRLPPEVWAKIFGRLYPSQLCRLSMVCRTFNTIISSLPYWSQIFRIARPDRQLRLLQGYSESRCYMTYLCAVSLHLCEECFQISRLQEKHLAELPLPVLVTLPNPVRNDTRAVAGEAVNLRWRVRKCRQCRDEHSTDISEDALPPWRREIKEKVWPILGGACLRDFPFLHQVPDLHMNPHAHYSEADIMPSMRRYFGGPVGVEASRRHTTLFDDKTYARLLWYREQD